LVGLKEVIGKKANASSLKSQLNSISVPTKNRKLEHIFRRLHDLCKDIFEARISIEFNENMIKEGE